MSREEPETESVGIFKTVKNKRVIDLLKKQGKNVIEFPQISPRKIEPDKQDIDLLNEIGKFDWLIFADIFAVDYFLEELENTGFELFELDELKICACGEAVADKLRFSQIHSDVIPSRLSGDFVISSIKEYIFDDEQFFDSTFLLVKSRNKISTIAKYFDEETIKYSEIYVCEIEKSEDFNSAKLKTLISGGSIDRIIFTSPEDIESFLILSDDVFKDSIQELEIDVTDDLTAQAFRELNIQI